jgi:hypothetical protein
MAMSLVDIEAKADQLAQRLLAAGMAEARLISLQISGLRDLAQIKAVGDQRAQWNSSVMMSGVSALPGNREKT